MESDKDRLNDLHTARLVLDGRRSRTASLLVLGIAGLLSAAFTWMAWAEVEEVVSASGRVEPAGRVQTINHVAGGRVAMLHVEDGQPVEKGQLLVTFAPEIAEHARAEALEQWQASAATVARLEAELAAGDLSLPEALAVARPDIARRELELLEASREARANEQATLNRQIDTRRGDVLRADADLSRLDSNLALLNQQLEAVKDLADQGLYPRLKAIEMEREAADLQGERAKANAALSSARAALEQAKSERQRLDKRLEETLQADLNEAITRRDTLASQLAGRETIVEETVLRAPIGGIVQDLTISGAGQAVAANATLMKLVPTGGGLIIKAQVANRDIGRVTPNLSATVKVRAYDFARYGKLEGTVQQIAADATARAEDELPSYTVTVHTESDYLDGDPRNAVVPGMVVDVELTVGERTVLSYLTDTIVSYREKALREG